MGSRSLAPRLNDMIEAIDVIRANTENVTLDAFEADRDKRWLVERAVEIISEASRHLGDELKHRHPGIPGGKWRLSATCSGMIMHGSLQTSFGL